MKYNHSIQADIAYPKLMHESSNELTLIFATDANFFPGLLVSAASLTAAAPRHLTLIIHLLDGGLSNRQWQRFQRTLRRWNRQIQFVRHSVASFPLQRYARRHPIGAMSLARLYIPQLIEQSGRVIYVDVDMFILDDISPLMNVDLGGHPCGAVIDAPQAILADDCPFPLDQNNNTGQEPYFNAGLLVIDLGTWREQQVSQRCLDLIESSDCYLRNGDQTVLNYILANQWQPLAERFNELHTHFRIEEVWQGTSSIVHFKGSTKPWHCYEPGREAFLVWYLLARLTAGYHPLEMGLLVLKPWLEYWCRQLLQANPTERARWRSARTALRQRLQAAG